MANEEITHLPDGTPLQGGRYKIVRFIGSGGFGCTYEGEHCMLQRRVAIKEFFVKDFCDRDESTAQVTISTSGKRELIDKLKGKFVEEARATSRMQHPNIVKVYDVFEENGAAYYVMDYIDGPSLEKIVKTDGPLSEQTALKYIRQVADALGYVHSLNRLHLDLKPGNIMTDGHGNAILVDFGASKQYDEAGGENTSTLIGKTPGYAPIEQMGNSVSTFSPATDIYALGATLYKLLTGVTPPGSNLLASGEELPALPSNISVSTANAISATMRTARKGRPQSVAEFLSLLDPAEAGATSSGQKSNAASRTASEETVLDDSFGERKSDAQKELMKKPETKPVQKDEINLNPASYKMLGGSPFKSNNRGMVKFVLLSLITIGIYGIVVMTKVGNDINDIASCRDGKHTMNYCWIFFIFSWLTIGIAPLVWQDRITKRIGDELRARNLPYEINTGTFWGWFVLGSLLYIGPFIYYHKFFKAMNMVCDDYNKRQFV